MEKAEISFLTLCFSVPSLHKLCLMYAPIAGSYINSYNDSKEVIS